MVQNVNPLLTPGYIWVARSLLLMIFCIMGCRYVVHIAAGYGQLLMGILFF